MNNTTRSTWTKRVPQLEIRAWTFLWRACWRCRRHTKQYQEPINTVPRMVQGSMKEVDVELRSTVKEDDHQKLIMPRFNMMKRMQHDEEKNTKRSPPNWNMKWSPNKRCWWPHNLVENKSTNYDYQKVDESMRNEHAVLNINQSDVEQKFKTIINVRTSCCIS